MTPAATDLLVIGGGPAGLATAIRARLAGLSVRVLERAAPPIDKACGEGLMPDAVARLAELGVGLAPRECRVLRGIRYIDYAGPGGGGGSASLGAAGGAVVAEGHFPRASGLGVRRLHLHQALVRRAAEVGVDLRWGVAARGLARAGQAPEAVAGAITDHPGLELAAARWIVGADGLASQVRCWAGLEGPQRPAGGRGRRRRRFGVRRHFACAPWSDLVEVYWGPGCEAYVTPVGPDEVGVAMLWGEAARDRLREVPAQGGITERGAAAPASAESRFDELLAHFPSLAARLAGAPAASRDRGAGPLWRRPLAVWRGNVALVGDASGYVDAITGEGLAVALHQSAALVEALGAADAAAPAPPLARYAAAHRRIGRLPDAMTSLVLAIERRPWLRHRVLRALAIEPALFTRLLGIHARTLPPARLGIDGALRLVYRLVTA